MFPMSYRLLLDKKRVFSIFFTTVPLSSPSFYKYWRQGIFNKVSNKTKILLGSGMATQGKIMHQDVLC